MEGKETKKERVVIDLTKAELNEFAKYAGLQSTNTGVFILRAFLSTWIMALPKNRLESKTHKFTLNNNTSYDRD